MSALRDRRCWRALSRHHDDVKDLHLRELFAADPGRGKRFVAEAGGLCLDHSKNRVTPETIRLLLALADEVDDPVATAARRSSTTGLIEHGLFAPALVSELLVARGERVDRITTP